jgi:hypothetical protein
MINTEAHVLSYKYDGEFAGVNFGVPDSQKIGPVEVNLERLTGAHVGGEGKLYLMMTLRLWKINARTWLGTYLQACVDNDNHAPADITPFLPWAMEASRLAAMRVCHPVNGRIHVEGIDSS